MYFERNEWDGEIQENEEEEGTFRFDKGSYQSSYKDCKGY